MAARKDLGTLLVEEKVISSGDLERARKEHREQGGRLLDHLLRLALVTEGDVFALLGGRAGIAAVPDDRLGGVAVPLESPKLPTPNPVPTGRGRALSEPIPA